MQILVIRLGALGDMALSFPAFAALRAHHAADRITLLTTAPFAALSKASPWFDAVAVDRRPAWHDLRGIVRLRRQLAGHDFVYDLQTSRRSSRYFRLAGRPGWSGIARGCSHPDPDPGRDRLHTVARQRGQLAACGVAAVEPALGWLASGGPTLPAPYALVVPGTSPAHGGAKRWPTGRYADLAVALAARGLLPVIVGTAQDAAAAAAIVAACAQAVDLTGRTSLQELAGLASRAEVAVGGDTGPIHLAAMMGCAVVALFSRSSDPALAAPVGRAVVLRANRLDEISVERVLEEGLLS